MRRSVAIAWHASFLIISAALYFFFVLPRWYELTGATSHTLGTALRIVCAVVIALSALPVLLTLQRTRRPEYGTPQLALSLRTASIVLHVVGGVLILGTAISEIWLSLDKAGPWLFGVYGAAAGVTLLAALAFYLAFLAELPPPPPKPIKPAKAGRSKRPDPAEADVAESQTAEADDDTEADTEAGTETEAVAGVSLVKADQAESSEETEDADTEASDTETAADEPSDAKLRNRRSGKGSGLFGRSGGKA